LIKEINYETVQDYTAYLLVIYLVAAPLLLFTVFFLYKAVGRGDSIFSLRSALR
jgi:hypothetical protein